MTIHLNKLYEINHPVFRNIQYIGFDEFDDLNNDRDARKLAHRLTDSIDNNTQYHAIDFIFQKNSWLPSRFGNGSYPIWYASIELDTSFHETLYHWYRTFIQAPEFPYDSNTSIKTDRTVFSVNCSAALVDLRDQCKVNSKIISPDKSHYATTQKLGEKIYQQGLPGLITHSARTREGENVAIFNKYRLSRPIHFGDFIYEYHTSQRIAHVTDKLSKKLMLSNVF